MSTEQPQGRIVEILVNGLKAIKELNPANRDINDAQRIARRTLRDARIEMDKSSA